MTLLLQIVYVVVCLFLIVVVLLQHGKGADIGVSLGAGSSNTVFGARGAGNFLTKLTTASAILFMVLAFSLARFAANTSADDLLSPPASDAPSAPRGTAAPEAESTAPPSEPGGAPSGFESIETPAKPQSAAPDPNAPAPNPAPAAKPAPAPAKPPS